MIMKCNNFMIGLNIVQFVSAQYPVTKQHHPEYTIVNYWLCNRKSELYDSNVQMKCLG